MEDDGSGRLLCRHAIECRRVQSRGAAAVDLRILDVSNNHISEPCTSALLAALVPPAGDHPRSDVAAGNDWISSAVYSASLNGKRAQGAGGSPPSRRIHVPIGLQELDLSLNGPRSYESFQALARLLYPRPDVRMAGLTRLHLRDCGLNDAALEMLATSLEFIGAVSLDLLDLDLSCNRIARYC